MKRIVFGVWIAVLVFSFAAQAQVPGQPDPEHKKLEVWAGNWTHIGYVFWLQWGGTATYTMTFKDRTILTGGQGWRQAWAFSPDGMSLTGKREREQDGKWWTSFDVKGVKK